MITNRRSLGIVLALAALTALMATGCASSGSQAYGGGGGYAVGDLDCYSNYDPAQAAYGYGYGSAYGYSYGGYGYGGDPCSAFPSRYVGYYPDVVSTTRHVAPVDRQHRTHTVQRPVTAWDSPSSGASSGSSWASDPASASAPRMAPAPVSAPAPAPTTVHPRGN